MVLTWQLLATTFPSKTPLNITSPIQPRAHHADLPSCSFPAESMAAVRSLENRNNGPRTYVLDTNVLLYDPNAIEVFEDNELVIPITVIEEVDRFKKDLNETGRNARLVSRRLDELRQTGRLSRGVPLGSGGRLRVEIPTQGDTQMPAAFSDRSNDNRILSVALNLSSRAEPGQVIMVTRDTKPCPVRNKEATKRTLMH